MGRALFIAPQIYQDNYPAGDRGRRFAWTIIIRMVAAIAFGQLGGWLLSDQTRLTLGGFVWTGGMSWSRAMFVAFALAFFFSAWCLRRVPSRPLSATHGAHPFKALRCFRQDALFRRTLISWMFMGFANLMMVPLRVEYLANPEHLKTAGDAVMTAGSVAMLTTVVPNLARLVTTPFWGWVFDRMNFFMLRIVLNCGFMLGILSFFTTDSQAGLVFGAVVFGVSVAGGDVAWSLWVTKFAPPERVADYMATHTFLTGVRGVIAPLVAFELAGRLSFGTLGWISAGLIAVGTFVLVPEVLERRQGRQASALVEEDIPD